MKVVSMVVAVLLSSTVECSKMIASEDLCEQIRSNQLEIFTMGTRGRSQDDGHFYILAKGGYMFKVPLADLRVDAPNRTTSITIDRDYIRVDLLDVSRDLFSRTNRFFLISNQNRDALLCQMFLSQERSQWAFQLYDLNDTVPIRDHQQEYVQYDEPIHVMSNIGIDSNTTNGFALYDKLLVRRYTFEVGNKDEFKVTRRHPNVNIYSQSFMEFPSNTDIVTVFYHKENPKNEAGYYYFLDAKGLITLTRRENAWHIATSVDKVKDLYSDPFEVDLSSFVVCHFKQTTAPD